jgi:hypothetical protein
LSKRRKTRTVKDSLQPTEKSTSISNSSNKYKGEEKMNTSRKIAIMVGVFYIAATVAGVLSLPFTEPTLNAPDYLTGVSANQNQVLIGALLALVMAVAVAGIAITVYPVLRKHNASIAIGYVGARIVEGVIDIISVISLLALVKLSQEFVEAGAPDASYYQTLGDILLAVQGWGVHVVLDVAVFPLGALIFNYLLYQSKLVPRWLSGWGLIGAPLWLAGGVLVMFGHDPFSTIPVLSNLPIGVQEMVFAVWMIVKGFNSTTIASESA